LNYDLYIWLRRYSDSATEAAVTSASVTTRLTAADGRQFSAREITTQSASAIITHRQITSLQRSAAISCTVRGVYKFNQADFQEIPGGILRKIQDMFALLWPPM